MTRFFRSAPFFSLAVTIVVVAFSDIHFGCGDVTMARTSVSRASFTSGLPYFYTAFFIDRAIARIQMNAII